ncbi:MAG: YciI family protein [Myxococcota bacterium]
MFIVFLEFAENKARAPELMQEHNAWIRRGFDEGVFALVGSLESKRGGAIVAHGTSREALQTRVESDPFVIAGVVSAQIIELTPSRTDERLKFLAD